MNLEDFKLLSEKEQQKVYLGIKKKKDEAIKMILHRNIEDVKIQTKTYKYLEKERLVLKEKLELDFTIPYFIEQEYRLNATEQELNGVLVDENHIKTCVNYLDTKVESLRLEIEPLLPNQVKPKGVKVSKKELADLLGFKGVKDSYVTDENGNLVVEKPYIKPTTSYTKTAKSKQYQGMLYEEVTPVFTKLTDCKEWIKTNKPNTKVKDWFINKTEIEVEKLNVATCKYFDLEESQTDVVSGPFTKVEFSPTKMTQHAQVKDYLLSLGWKPTEWNYKKSKEGGFARDERRQLIPTTPKLTEDSYDSLPEGVGLKIAHYNTYNHRRRFLENEKDDEKGILNCIRPDGRITAGINNFSTSTGRSSHSIWVNPPGAGALFGEEIRKSIISPKGRKLVSSDMKSAQLSIAAYYANNYDYYKAVADGQEIKTDTNGTELIHPVSGEPWYIGESGHCVNARMFTLVSEEEYERAVRTQDKDLLHSISLRRKKSKGGSFAVIFGASGKKVATTLGIPERLGEEKKQSFLQNIGLDEPIEILNRMVSKNARAGGGYIELPFGYYVWCKHPHKLFNYLDQGTEAACQKFAVNYFESKIKEYDLDCKKVLDYHK